MCGAFFFFGINTQHMQLGLEHLCFYGPPREIWYLPYLQNDAEIHMEILGS